MNSKYFLLYGSATLALAVGCEANIDTVDEAQYRAESGASVEDADAEIEAPRRLALLTSRSGDEEGAEYEFEFIAHPSGDVEVEITGPEGAPRLEALGCALDVFLEVADTHQTVPPELIAACPDSRARASNEPVTVADLTIGARDNLLEAVAKPGAEQDDSTGPLRIIGGRDTDIREFPWQVSLWNLDKGRHDCGGSIIGSSWILTAAHCVHDVPSSSLRIYAGATNQSLRVLGQIRSVVRRVIHPDYRPGKKPISGDDVALLQLDRPLNLTGDRARRIRFATLADTPWFTPNTKARVSGWGFVTHPQTTSPDALQSIEIPIVPNPVAHKIFMDRFDHPVRRTEITAGDLTVGGRNICHGDSGGALVVDSPRGPVQVGIVSWSFPCAHEGFPSVYARVAHFAEWIAGHVNDRTRSEWIVDLNRNGESDFREEFGTPFDYPMALDISLDDGKADFAMLRDNNGQWQWLIDRDLDGDDELDPNFGLITDIPVPGKYGALGKSANLAVVRAVGSQWQWIVDFERNGVPDFREFFGLWTDIPVPADYDGDTRVDFAVVRADGDEWQWIVDRDRNGDTEIRENFGLVTDRLMPADYDGEDGVDFAVVRKSGGQWRWLVDTDKDERDEIDVHFGLTTDWPFTADFNKDDKADLAVLRKVGHQWQWIIDTDRDGTFDRRINYGNHTDLPLAADFNGGKKADLVVVRDLAEEDTCQDSIDICHVGCNTQFEMCRAAVAGNDDDNDEGDVTMADCLEGRLDCQRVCDSRC